MEQLISQYLWPGIGCGLLLFFIRQFFSRNREDMKNLGKCMKEGFAEVNVRMDKMQENHNSAVNSLRRELHDGIKETNTAIQTTNERQLKQAAVCAKEFVTREEHERATRRLDDRINTLENKEIKTCAAAADDLQHHPHHHPHQSL